MAAISYTFVQQNTEQTTTGNAAYTNVTGGVIAADWGGVGAGFVAGKKYLLYITAKASVDYGGRPARVQVLHGSTVFADSESHMMGTDVHVRYVPYCWFTVWTAVAAEAIQMQFSSGTTAEIIYLDQIAMLAICLSDDVVENTDWFYNVNAAAEGSGAGDLSTTPLAGATITFTPGGASDWLVLSAAQITAEDTTTLWTSALVRSGEASTSTPAAKLRAGSATNGPKKQATLTRVFACTAVSNTFTETSSAAASTHYRTASSIFAINLNKFSTHNTIAYTEAALNYTASAWADDIRTSAITPTVQGDVWVGTYFTNQIANVNRISYYRLQVDDVDTPSDQTTDLRPLGDTGINNQSVPTVGSTVVNMTAALHAIDVDGYVNATTGIPNCIERSIWAVTMELAAGAPTPPLPDQFDAVTVAEVIAPNLINMPKVFN